MDKNKNKNKDKKIEDPQTYLAFLVVGFSQAAMWLMSQLRLGVADGLKFLCR